MYFNYQTVGPDGDACTGKRIYHIVMTGPVRRIDDDGQVRTDALDGPGTMRQVHCIAGMRCEGANAALAKNDIVITLGHYVFGGEQKLVERCGKPAL